MVNLSKEQLGSLKVALDKGMVNATNALSELLAKKISVSAPDVVFKPIREVPDLIGGPEAGVASIYVQVEGDVNGHIMLVMGLSSAFNLADILLEKQENETKELDEMDRSALEEVGNITGSYFLTSLVNHSQLDVHPSPPSCMVDMAGAVLSSVLADVSKTADQVLVMETIFSVRSQHIKGYFFLFPEPESLNLLLKALGA